MKKFPGKKLFSLPELIAFRKDMHQHAEIGFKEVNTQKKIIAYLEKIGIDKKTIQKCAKTGKPSIKNHKIYINFLFHAPHFYFFLDSLKFKT